MCVFLIFVNSLSTMRKFAKTQIFRIFYSEPLIDSFKKLTPQKRYTQKIKILHERKKSSSISSARKVMFSSFFVENHPILNRYSETRKPAFISFTTKTPMISRRRSISREDFCFLNECKMQNFEGSKEGGQRKNGVTHCSEYQPG